MDQALIADVSEAHEIRGQPGEKAEVVGVTLEREPVAMQQTSQGRLVVAGSNVKLGSREIMDRSHAEQLEEAREPEPGVGHRDHRGGSGSHDSLELACCKVVVLQMLHHLAAQREGEHTLLE